MKKNRAAVRLVAVSITLFITATRSGYIYYIHALTFFGQLLFFLFAGARALPHIVLLFTPARCPGKYRTPTPAHYPPYLCMGISTISPISAPTRPIPAVRRVSEMRTHSFDTILAKDAVNIHVEHSESPYQYAHIRHICPLWPTL